jgi:shikimate 5-dehydrogenase
MRRARARGVEVRGGLDMFLAQGAAQFALFTGKAAPIAAMRRAVTTALHPEAAPAPRATRRERHADR